MNKCSCLSLSRYFILFGTYAPNANKLNPLSAILKLLLGTKTNQVVCGTIMEILENLLTLKDHRQLDENDMEVDETHLEERAPPIKATYVLPLNEEEIEKLNCKYNVYIFLISASNF